jgi:subtilisin family serine protease
MMKSPYSYQDAIASGVIDALPRILTIFILLFFLGLMPAVEVFGETNETRTFQPRIIRNYTPEVWKADDVRWLRDIDPHNHIDDIIDASTDGLFDIVINFKRCVEDDDIETIENLGSTSYVKEKLKLITSVTVNDISKAEMETLLSTIPDIAFIEGRWGFKGTLINRLQNMKVIPDYYSENVHNLNDGITGYGVNIAILDTGVDDEEHSIFDLTHFMAGYDVYTDEFKNPDDEDGHGTFLASIALGSGSLEKDRQPVTRGVAREANLIDIRVRLGDSEDCIESETWDRIIEGLEVLYDKVDTWYPHVMLLPFNQCHNNVVVPSCGLDVVSQITNLSESLGIVAVVGVGNHGLDDGFGIASPAAASRAITVAASDCSSDIDRLNSTIYSMSNGGPLVDPHLYCDFPVRHEIHMRKPDVTAPGVNVWAAKHDTETEGDYVTGTCAAAAHIAGVAALLIQALKLEPPYDREINPASVKQKINNSTLSMPDPFPSFRSFPNWSRKWGWGLIDAYRTVADLLRSDVGFPNHPAVPDYLSKDLSIDEGYSIIGYKTYDVRAVFENSNDNWAYDVTVNLGIHDLSGAIPAFYHADIHYFQAIEPGATWDRTLTWFVPEGIEGHFCAEVEIGYGADTDFSNNKARRNFDIARSPVYFDVQNILTEEPATIYFVPTFENPDPGWDLEITPPNVTLAADDCPVEIEVELTPPPDALPGSEQTAHITTMINNIPVGGVSVYKKIPQFPDVAIEKLHDVLQGHYTEIPIYFKEYPLEMGGFDFLIAYDASALSFVEAYPGDLLENCEWEYFTYSHGATGSCGGGCPSGMLRIVALAETSDGPNHPACFGPPDTDRYELARLKFLVTNDRTFECQYVPIYFFWSDCGDNTISNVAGDSLYIERTVSDFTGNLIWDEDDDDQFPEDARIPFVGAPDYCLNSDPEKPSPIRFINFINGGIDIICADDIDDRGDINMNGIVNEISDAVVFTNYFIHGLAAFVINQEGQIAATDVNADGVVLSVADLTYLIRLIIGDAIPYTKTIPVTVEYDNEDGILSVNREMGAACVVIKGNANPVNLTGNMEMRYAYDSENDVTRVLLYSMERDRKIEGEFLDLNGTLIEIEVATYEGSMVKLVSSHLPEEFVLYQNKPNPFNPITDFMFILPVASNVTLEIYNITGQRVTTVVEDHFEAGAHTVRWDGSDFASGIYLFRITAGEFIASKKMLLLK